MIASTSCKTFVLFRHRYLGGFAKAIEVPVGSLAGRNFQIKENRPTESGVRVGIGLNLERFKSSGQTLRAIPSSLLESLRRTAWGFLIPPSIRLLANSLRECERSQGKRDGHYVQSRSQGGVPKVHKRT